MGSATVQTQRGLQAERISALVDGEFDSDELAALLDEADASGRPLWDDYHLIGDALRSDELTLPRSESAFMAAFSGKVAAFIDANPTFKMLALSFLVLIGVLLLAEGAGTHIGKGYIYASMAFALGVELLNMRARKKKDAKKKAELREEHDAAAARHSVV